VAVGGEEELRLFAAVDVPEGQRKSIESATAPLHADLPQARWTKPEQWHLTLKFFGQVPEDRLPQLIESIGLATQGTGLIESALEDLGAFPSVRRARVLWVGLADPELKLKTLAERIGSECGYPPEERFKAHLTLARFKVPQSIGRVIDRHRPLELDRSPFVIDKATLFQSILGREGAKYTPVAEFPLHRSGA
jgi:RNA 2',3'-cyclic 3'-phosphodiesterase